MTSPSRRKPRTTPRSTPRSTTASVAALVLLAGTVGEAQDVVRSVFDIEPGDVPKPIVQVSGERTTSRRREPFVLFRGSSQPSRASSTSKSNKSPYDLKHPHAGLRAPSSAGPAEAPAAPPGAPAVTQAAARTSDPPPVGNLAPTLPNGPEPNGPEPNRLEPQPLPQTSLPTENDPYGLGPIQNIQPYADYDPNPDEDGPGKDLFPEVRELPLVVGNHRSACDITFSWEASNLYSNPLYFDDPKLERYGHTYWGPVQPFVSVGRFGVQLIALPYKSTIDPYCKRMYALGWYRPGDCAPQQIEPIPWNAKAAAVQGAATTGAFLLFP